MNRVPWLDEARRHIGLREVPGVTTAPTIGRWLRELRAWWADDETPWCGVAVAAWMRAAGIEPARNWFRARAWLEWGAPITEPAAGCVVVVGRAGGGHVGLVIGEDERGRLMVLGGNQGDAVTVAPFERSRVLGYRWPAEHMAMLMTHALPRVAAAHLPSSRNEA